VGAKSPGELQAYKNTILSVAQASAEAAKEGGLLGIGGTLVARKCKPRSTPSRFPSADAAA